MITKRVLLVATLALSLSACNATTGNKGTMGTLLGAGGGALLGSQIGGGKGKLAAVAVGAVAGAFLGKSVGDSLDDLDRMKMQQTSQVSLERIPDGQVSGWQNPNSGNSGTITPTRTFQEAGTYCREYQQTVVINGQKQTAYGSACRQPDGSWKIKS